MNVLIANARSYGYRDPEFLCLAFGLLDLPIVPSFFSITCLYD